MTSIICKDSRISDMRETGRQFKDRFTEKNSIDKSDGYPHECTAP